MGDKDIGYKAVQDAIKGKFFSKLNTNYLANPEREYTGDWIGADSDRGSYGD